MKQIKEYFVFFGADGKCIGLPEPVEDGIDMDAALECAPAEACFHGAYTKERLLELGYFQESDFKDEDD